MRQKAEDFARNLALWRSKLGLSQQALSERSGIGYRTITRLESSGANPRLSTLETLAKVFRVEPWQMLLPPPGSTTSEVVRIEAFQPSHWSAVRSTTPVTGARSPSIEHVEANEGWASQVLGMPDPSAVRIMEVIGDAMAPSLNEGDVLFVDVTVQEVNADGIYVFTRGTQLLVKRLQLLSDRLAVISDNKKYERDNIPLDEIEQTITIHGRVIGRWGFERTS